MSDSKLENYTRQDPGDVESIDRGGGRSSALFGPYRDSFSVPPDAMVAPHDDDELL